MLRFLSLIISFLYNPSLYLTSPSFLFHSVSSHFFPSSIYLSIFSLLLSFSSFLLPFHSFPFLLFFPLLLFSYLFPFYYFPILHFSSSSLPFRSIPFPSSRCLYLPSVTRFERLFLFSSLLLSTSSFLFFYCLAFSSLLSLSLAHLHFPSLSSIPSSAFFNFSLFSLISAFSFPFLLSVNSLSF